MSAPNNRGFHQPRLAIIAALEREIAAVVRGWTRKDVEYSGRKLRFYESEKAVVVSGGIGMQAARLAAEAAVNLYEPLALVSTGLAGSLSEKLKVGDTLFAAEIVDAESGKVYSTPAGSERLVTANTILGLEEKRALAQRFAAGAVDMEAASVADVARQARVPFFAVKAISDELEFPMPKMEQFVDAQGNFGTGRFIFHAALRPQLWSSVFHLARNSSRAAKALARLLTPLIEQQYLTANAIESGIEPDTA
jgi:adenosylhomocysteine nucleosidase